MHFFMRKIRHEPDDITVSVKTSSLGTWTSEILAEYLLEMVQLQWPHHLLLQPLSGASLLRILIKGTNICPYRKASTILPMQCRDKGRGGSLGGEAQGIGLEAGLRSSPVLGHTEQFVMPRTGWMENIGHRPFVPQGLLDSCALPFYFRLSETEKYKIVVVKSAYGFCRLWGIWVYNV